ncbi:MAG TPA: serine hydrolase domain-containing protein [Methylomirabilota bacterium]|nr:serine hydrolase domain-containing protein [Methylomirabilota bacterium]
MATRTSALLVRVLLVTVWFAPVVAQPAPAVDHRARIEAATYAIGFPGPDQAQLTFPQWMNLLRVPATSVAVIDDYKIAWTAQYGIADIEHSQQLSPHTLLQAGSISKSVNAFGIMRLVQQGRLTLDEDVNRRLKRWKVPENEFTQREKVTLRRILSHTAGLTVQGFPGYAVNEPMPTLLQVLDGQKPANTKPVRVDLVPGTKLRYAGGGTIISQLLLSETTGEPYERWMQENVIDPIGMSDSSYENPPPKAHAALTATGYRATGQPVGGRWHVYPEMAAAGLWTTPTDLAKFGIELMRALKGKSTLVSRETAEAMLTEQKDGAALGFFVDTKTGQFGHNGAARGSRRFSCASEAAKALR